MRASYLFLLCMAFVSGLSACSEKDEGIQSENVMRLYGMPYHVQSGVIWQSNPNVVVSSIPYVYKDMHDGETDEIEGFRAGTDRIETGNFQLSMYESGLSHVPGVESAQGKAACICLHLSSPETNRLVPGTYQFGAEKHPFTFVGYCACDYSTQENNGVGAEDYTPAALAEGEVTVAEEGGGNYRVSLQAKTTAGGAVDCVYYGKLDVCQVSQIVSSEYKDVSLSGLLPEVERIYWTDEYIVNQYAPMEDMSLEEFVDAYGLIKYEDGEGYLWPDETYLGPDLNYNGRALLSLSTGLPQTARNFRDKLDDVDLALTWDEEQQSFLFESPIRLRGMLGRSARYDFRSHTVYMKAPDTFTDADFENLTTESFSFVITNEEPVAIPTRDFRPSYVFFQTGKGVQGIIKVKSYTPQKMQLDIDWDWGYGHEGELGPLNPSLLLDIKCPTVIANKQIR